MVDPKPPSSKVPSIGYTSEGIVLTLSYGPFEYNTSIGTAQVDRLIEALEAAKEGYREEHTYMGAEDE